MGRKKTRMEAGRPGEKFTHPAKRWWGFRNATNVMTWGSGGGGEKQPIERLDCRWSWTKDKETPCWADGTPRLAFSLYVPAPPSLLLKHWNTSMATSPRPGSLHCHFHLPFSLGPPNYWYLCNALIKNWRWAQCGAIGLSDPAPA